MLVKWNPYTEIDKTFDRFVRDPFLMRSFWDDGNGEVVPWQPAVNVQEDKEKLSIEVELPGIDMKDVDLSVTDHTLEIRGERKAERKEDQKGYHVQEVRYGSFSRTFKLPTYVDTGKVKASYERGILTVIVPKHETARPRVIEIEGK